MKQDFPEPEDRGNNLDATRESIRHEMLRTNTVVGVVLIIVFVLAFTGLGVSAILYTVQANTNLATATWINIGSATAAAGGNLQFTDVNAPNFKQRFYRFANP